MKTALYIRVSTDEQAKEGYSIPAQKDKLMAYIRSQDWEFVDLYIDEGRSGKDLERQELHRLRADIRTGRIEVVLVYRLDRLTRSVLDLYHLLQEFETYQVKFRSATEIYDTTTAMGRLFLTLVAALAQWERENLGERTRMGKEEKIKQGKRAGGNIPYGYRLDHGTLAIHDQEATTVKLIYQLYHQYGNMNRVADRLFQLGIFSRKGTPFSVKTVRDILRNPVYIGTLRYNHARKHQNKNKAVPLEDVILIENAHPAILSAEDFSSLQQQLKHQSKKSPRTLSSTYLFSGLVLCPHCRHTLIGKTSKNHRYYHCSYTKPGACHQYSIREDQLERLFIQLFQTLLRQITIQLLPLTQNTTLELKPNEQSLYQKEQAHLTQKEHRLHELFLAGMIDIQEFQKQITAIQQRREEINELLNQKESSDALNDESCQTLIETLLNVDQIWNYMSRDEQQKVIHLLVASIKLRYHDQQKMWVIDSISYHP
ncbi:recombinase family protein [Brevibacillus ginsengisoli]|uniref:recombinase family protein n=1 Tax=Brevibacillus ginsengisoli TaxID=363854 RepID=UPI003CF51160